MTADLTNLLRQALASLRDPRGRARWVMSIDMPRGARWEALLLIVLISVLLAHVSLFLVPLAGDPIFGLLQISPLAIAIIQMSLLVIMVFAIFWIGRALGGTGGFGNAILLVAWTQFILAALQIIQTAALILIPPLGNLLGMAGLVLFFWLLTNFIAELHGFSSLGKVFVMILLAMFGFAFGLSLILTMIGVSMPGVPV